MNKRCKTSENAYPMRMPAMRGILISFLLILAACTRHQGCEEAFLKADSLMDEHPDSAIIILEDIRSGKLPLNKSESMRSLLLLAKAQNKAYATMPDDSIFEEVVEYYDKHGTPNDQVLAHYLHGCISRDLNDAPKALERYMEAVAHADTTDTDCDYSTLLGVYGQMSNIFYLQNLPKEEIQALEKAGYYSLKAGNIRNYIKCIELHMRPYYEMDDTAAIIETTFRARNLYLKNGFIQEAASVYPYAIFIYLKQGRFEEAHKMMEDFECHSGLFSNGEIEPRRRQYEYSRGMYFEGVNQLDSAEYHYRKALAYGFKFEGSKGLLSLYSTKGNLDSVKKYAPLYVQSVDEANAKLQTEAVLKMKALYDYSQSKKEAENQKRKAGIWKMSLFMCLLLALCVYFILRSRKSKAINRKIQEIELLQNTIKQMEEGNGSPDDRLDEFEESDIVKRLKQKVGKKEYASASELAGLRAAAVKHLPSFIQTLGNTGYELQSHETDLCVLIKVGFRPSEIAILMNMTPQNITNLRARLNKKMFHADKGARDFDEKIINLTLS